VAETRDVGESTGAGIGGCTVSVRDALLKLWRDKLKADIIIRLQSGAVSLVLTVSRLVGIPL
jgi:hypothetical protein